MRRWPVRIFAAWLAAAAPAAGVTQTPAQWQQEQMSAIGESDAIMRRADAQRDLLAQYQVMRRAYAANGKPAFRAIFGQYLSWYQTFLGDYEDAESSFTIKQEAMPDDHPVPLGTPGWHAVAALTYLPKLAKSRRVVFLNESHNIALTRTLTVRLLRPLRAEGFNVFAVETLYREDIPALNARGYPTVASGFYTREPIYAEMVRTALKLGYRVVAYEADRYHTGSQREVQQAQNLWRILKDNPNAKLVVNAGYAHIQKTGRFLGGESMAERFMADSGIDPLSIEQTILIPHQDSSMNHPDYDRIVAAIHPTAPIVLVNRDGKPWSLRPGYDASVIFPPQKFVDGRPTWAELWGARVPYLVGGSECERHWPCLVAARYADEPDAAIPADRMVLDPVPLMTVDDIKIIMGNHGLPRSELYLRPGHRYRLTFSDERGQRLGGRTMTVPLRPADSAVGAPRPSRPVAEPADAIKPITRLDLRAKAGTVAIGTPARNASDTMPRSQQGTSDHAPAEQWTALPVNANDWTETTTAQHGVLK